MSFTEGMTPADMAAVTGNTNSGWGDGGAWWIIILFLFAFCGGWGNNGFSNSGATENYVLASDFATLQRQIDSGISSLERKGDATQNGLCDGFWQAMHSCTRLYTIRLLGRDPKTLELEQSPRAVTEENL